MILPIFILSIVAISALAIARWPVVWGQILIWTLATQNAVVVSIWAVTKSTTVGRDLLYAKEALVAGGIIVAVIAALRLAASRNAGRVVWLILILGALCAVWIPISYLRHEPFEQIARGLRSISFPVLLLLVGLLVVPHADGAVRLRRTLWLSAIVLGITVIVERDFVPTRFWLDIGLQKYWTDVKGISPSFLNGGLPWNFFLQLHSGIVRRGVGIMTDPLDVSYYLLLPFGLAVSELCRAKRLHEVWLPATAAFFSATGVMWSLSRAPIAILAVVAVAVPLYTLARWRNSLTAAMIGGATAALFLAVLGGLSVATATRVTAAELFRPSVAVASPLSGPTARSSADVSPSVLPSPGASPSPAPSAIPRATPSAAPTPIAPLGSDTVPSHINATLNRLRNNWRAVIFGGGLGTAGVLSSMFIAVNQSSYENYYLDTSAQIGIVGGLLVAAILACAVIQLIWAAPPTGWVRFPGAVVLAGLAIAGLVSGQLEVLTSLGATWFFGGVLLATTYGSEQRVAAEMLREVSTAAS